MYANHTGNRVMYRIKSRYDNKTVHFGNWEYASTFGPRMVLVKVDPKDLVCVPYDCSQGKVRCCEYLVLKEVPNETKMKSHYESGFEGVEPETTPEEIENKYECLDCGTINSDDDNYCRGCGANLEDQKDEVDEMFCPRCGKKIADDDAKFCTDCGAEL